MKIIKANKTHSKEIIRMVTNLVSELVGTRFVVDEAEAHVFIEESIDKGKYIAFCAIDENEKAIGLVTVGESGAVYAGGTFGVIHEFYIAPEMRSIGIGKQLIERVKQIAIELHWKRLEVGAPPYPEWKRTKQFYLRADFQEIGPRLKWIAEQKIAPDG